MQHVASDKAYRLLDLPSEENYFEHAASVPVSDRWVTHLAWSRWVGSGSDKCECPISLYGIDLGHDDRFPPSAQVVSLQIADNVNATGLATLACGASDGSVTLVDVTQALVPEIDEVPFQNGFVIERAVSISAETPDCVDDRSITAIRWIDPPEGQVRAPYWCATHADMVLAAHPRFLQSGNRPSVGQKCRR